MIQVPGRSLVRIRNYLEGFITRILRERPSPASHIQTTTTNTPPSDMSNIECEEAAILVRLKEIKAAKAKRQAEAEARWKVAEEEGLGRRR